MQFAIFGIENGGLNLVANLFVMVLVVVWLALIVWTYLDARRRIEDPVLVACATAASLFPFIGTFVYSILRPPEFLDDASERELEIRAAELRVRQLAELSCPNCRYPVEKNFLRCPRCQRRLKDPCESCGEAGRPALGGLPVLRDALPGRARSRRRAESQQPHARQAAQRKPPVRAQARSPSEKPPAPTGAARRPESGSATRAPRRTPSAPPHASHAKRLRREAMACRTLILVKPDAFERGLTGEVISRFERKGLRLVALKQVQIDEELASVHYRSTPRSPSSASWSSSSPAGRWWRWSSRAPRRWPRRGR